MTPTVRLQDALLSLGPIACWPLTETAGGLSQDIVRSSHGTRTNGPLAGPGPCSDGTPAMWSVSASNQYSLVGNVALLRPANVTLLAWVCPNASAADKGVAGVANTGFNGYNLRIDSGAPKWRVGDGTATVATETGPTILTDSTRWYFIAGTHDGANIALYIDGDYYAGRAAAYPIGYGATTDFYLNQWDGNSTRAGAGGLAWVTVYNRALTRGDIKAIAHAWRG